MPFTAVKLTIDNPEDNVFWIVYELTEQNEIGANLNCAEVAQEVLSFLLPLHIVSLIVESSL